MTAAVVNDDSDPDDTDGDRALARGMAIAVSAAVQLIRFAAIALSWAMLVGGCSAGGVRLANGSDDAVQRFLAFPNADFATAQRAAPGFVFAWDTGADADALRSGNPGIILGTNVPFGRDPAPSGRTLDWWTAQHPDWIAYGCDRVMPAWAPSDAKHADVPLDIGNPAVVDWQVANQLAPAAARGLDAVVVAGADERIGAPPCGVFSGGAWQPLDYGADGEDAAIAWLEVVADRLHALPRPLALITAVGSIDFWLTGGLFGEGPTRLAQLAAAGDGIVDVTGFGNVVDDAWADKIAYMTRVQYGGRWYFVVAGSGDVEWSVASYLMASDGKSALFVGDDLRSLGWTPPPTVALGRACAPMSRDDSGAFRREFEGGIVLVNAGCDAVDGVCTAADERVALPGGTTFSDFDGRSVAGVVRLPARTARILRAYGAPRC